MGRKLWQMWLWAIALILVVHVAIVLWVVLPIVYVLHHVPVLVRVEWPVP